MDPENVAEREKQRCIAGLRNYHNRAPARCPRARYERPDSILSAPGGEFLLYQTEDGRTRLEVRVHQETVWLSLNQLAALFQRDKSVISRHIKNIFDEGELRREATVAKSATVQIEGGKQVMREIECFNLDVIISVGYRVDLETYAALCGHCSSTGALLYRRW